MEEIWSVRGVQQSSNWTTVTSPQSLDLWSRKKAVVERSTDLLKDKSCRTGRDMLKKARQEKHRRHPTILSRWYADEEYRKSLAAIVWKEHHIKLYDRIVVEKHIYTAKRAERIQNSKHWILTMNAEGGTQQSLNQRLHFARAKRECKRLHVEHLARTQGEHRAFFAVNK